MQYGLGDINVSSMPSYLCLPSLVVHPRLMQNFNLFNRILNHVNLKINLINVLLSFVYNVFFRGSQTRFCLQFLHDFYLAVRMQIIILRKSMRPLIKIRLCVLRVQYNIILVLQLIKGFIVFKLILNLQAYLTIRCLFYLKVKCSYEM